MSCILHFTLQFSEFASVVTSAVILHSISLCHIHVLILEGLYTRNEALERSWYQYKMYPFYFVLPNKTEPLFYHPEVCALKPDADSARGNTFQQVKYVVRKGMYGRDADNN